MTEAARKPWYDIVLNKCIIGPGLHYDEADMALKPHEDHILAAGSSSLGLYDLRRGARLDYNPMLEIRRIRWHPTDGNKLSTSNVRRSYSLWDAKRLEPVITVKGEHFQYEHEWQPEGRLLVLACDPGLRLVDPGQGIETSSVAMNDTWIKLCWMDNNRFACVNRKETLVNIYDLRSLSQPLVSIDPGIDKPNFIHPWKGGLLMLNELGRLSRLDDNGQLSLLSDRFERCLEKTNPFIIAEAELVAMPCYDEVLLCDLNDPDNKRSLPADLEGPHKVVGGHNPPSLVVQDAHRSTIVYSSY